MENNRDSLVYVAGKSGGHIVPALTLAKDEFSLRPKTRITMITTDSPLDKAIITSSSFVHNHCTLPVRSSTGITGIPSLLFFLTLSLVKSYSLLKKIRPRAVISLGGLVSIPVCMAAWWLNIPVTIYELNAVPGKAVKFVSRFATKVCCCFDSARSLLPCQHAARAPYPLRFDDSDVIPKDTARERLLIPPHARVLLVVGGSQGSQFINTLITRFAQEHSRAKTSGLDDHLFIIHQTGKLHHAQIRDLYASLGVRAMVFDYRHNMADVYAAADVVVARAGAGTLFELLFFKKPSLIIPLEAKSTDHQIDNATAMTKMAPQLFTVLKQDILEDNPRLAYKYLEAALKPTDDQPKLRPQTKVYLSQAISKHTSASL